MSMPTKINEKTSKRVCSPRLSQINRSKSSYWSLKHLPFSNACEVSMVLCHHIQTNENLNLESTSKKKPNSVSDMQPGKLAYTAKLT